MGKQVVLGLIEQVKILGKTADARVRARIDTGAKSNSIDIGLAKSLGIVPGKKKTVVKSSMGEFERPVVLINVEVAGMRMRGRFTLADRSRLKFPVLIGRNILRRGFIIDTVKK
jgi:hypothetical protein